MGLVLTYAVTLVGNFQWTMRQSAEVENMVRREGHCMERADAQVTISAPFR